MQQSTFRFLFSPLALGMFLAIFIFNIVALLTLDVIIMWENYFPVLLPMAILGGGAFCLHGPILRRIIPRKLAERLQNTDDLRDILLTLMALLFVFQALQPLVHLVYVITADVPYADPILHAWDLALGLDWMAYFQWVHDRPLTIKTLEIAYDSMTPVSVVGLIVMVLLGHRNRAFVFIHAFLATALVCVGIGQFFPALGATAFLIGDMSAFPNYPYPPGTYGVEYIKALREGLGTVVLDPNELPGLITFPSFHTAGSVVFAYAFLRTRLAVPAAIYAAVVVASAPIFGAHYLIDIAAGVIIGLAVSRAVEWGLDRRQAQGLGMLAQGV